MPVTISPPPLLELNRSSWDTPYQEDVIGGPYTINYESSDTAMDTLKIEFSHNGPIDFYLSDGVTPIDTPVYIRNSGTFLFKVRVNYQILNEQNNNITFRGLVKTTEESQTIPQPWYEIEFDPPHAFFDAEYGNTKEVRVYFQRANFNASGDTIIRRKMLPDGGWFVGPADMSSERQVRLRSQVDEESGGTPRLKLVFENLQGEDLSANWIVRPANRWRYKDQNGQELEATLELSKFA